VGEWVGGAGTATMLILLAGSAN